MEKFLGISFNWLYRGTMKFAEIEGEVSQLNSDSRRKLMALLVSLEIRDEQAVRSELTRRLDDKSKKDWIPLGQVKEQLSRSSSDE